MRKNVFNQVNPIVAALIASVLCMAIAFISFSALEPTVSFAATDIFTVEQEITGEIAFATIATDIVMSPDIAGLTGGISSGTTSVEVTTNDPQGYTLSIAFADSVAMQYEGGAQSIPNFGSGSAVYNFSVLTGSSSFAFAASSTNVVTALKNNGSNACGGSNIGLNNCWIMPVNATNAYTLVNRSTPTLAGGEETQIAFRVGVGANPSPVLPVGFYNATATLTANVQ